MDSQNSFQAYHSYTVSTDFNNWPAVFYQYNYPSVQKHKDLVNKPKIIC